MYIIYSKVWNNSSSYTHISSYVIWRVHPLGLNMTSSFHTLTVGVGTLSPQLSSPPVSKAPYTNPMTITFVTFKSPYLRLKSSWEPSPKMPLNTSHISFSTKKIGNINHTYYYIECHPPLLAFLHRFHVDWSKWEIFPIRTDSMKHAQLQIWYMEIRIIWVHLLKDRHYPIPSYFSLKHVKGMANKSSSHQLKTMFFLFSFFKISNVVNDECGRPHQNKCLA